PAECLVIEDAYSGLLGAKRAGFGTIIAIVPFGKNKTVFEQAQLNKEGTI
ncbi:HAD family phosphatase, partial [Enterococcus faecium]